MAKFDPVAYAEHLQTPNDAPPYAPPMCTYFVATISAPDASTGKCALDVGNLIDSRTQPARGAIQRSGRPPLDPLDEYPDFSIRHVPGSDDYLKAAFLVGELRQWSRGGRVLYRAGFQERLKLAHRGKWDKAYEFVIYGHPDRLSRFDLDNLRKWMGRVATGVTKKFGNSDDDLDGFVVNLSFLWFTVKELSDPRPPWMGPLDCRYCPEMAKGTFRPFYLPKVLPDKVDKRTIAARTRGKDGEPPRKRVKLMYEELDEHTLSVSGASPIPGYVRILDPSKDVPSGNRWWPENYKWVPVPVPPAAASRGGRLESMLERLEATKEAAVARYGGDRAAEAARWVPLLARRAAEKRIRDKLERIGGGLEKGAATVANGDQAHEKVRCSRVQGRGGPVNPRSNGGLLERATTGAADGERVNELLTPEISALPSYSNEVVATRSAAKQERNATNGADGSKTTKHVRTGVKQHAEAKVNGNAPSNGRPSLSRAPLIPQYDYGLNKRRPAGDTTSNGHASQPRPRRGTLLDYGPGMEPITTGPSEDEEELDEPRSAEIREDGIGKGRASVPRTRAALSYDYGIAVAGHRRTGRQMSTDAANGDGMGARRPAEAKKEAMAMAKENNASVGPKGCTSLPGGRVGAPYVSGPAPGSTTGKLEPRASGAAIGVETNTHRTDEVEEYAKEEQEVKPTRKGCGGLDACPGLSRGRFGAQYARGLATASTAGKMVEDKASDVAKGGETTE